MSAAAIIIIIDSAIADLNATREGDLASKSPSELEQIKSDLKQAAALIELAKAVAT